MQSYMHLGFLSNVCIELEVYKNTKQYTYKLLTLKWTYIPTWTMAKGDQHFDCLIIGAGICGIDAAYHVQKYSPWANYAVLERSANIGGTWDQIKYPGRFLKFYSVTS